MSISNFILISKRKNYQYYLMISNGSSNDHDSLCHLAYQEEINFCERLKKKYCLHMKVYTETEMLNSLLIQEAIKNPVKILKR